MPAASMGIANNTGAVFVYFDHAPIYGLHHGTVQVELVVRTVVPAGKAVNNALVCTAHLRYSPDAARELINALARALAASPKPDSAQPN
jgi:hypothetical protein